MRKFNAICMGLMKYKENIIPFALLIGVFIFVSLYTTTTNIHGDSIFHSLFAKEIVNSGSLLQNAPYGVFHNDGEITNVPIYYPLTTHTLLAIFYMFGGEGFLKIFSPIFAALTALYIYLILKHINIYGAFFAAFFVIVANSPRYFLSPLIEQLLLFCSVCAIYHYFRYLKERNLKYLVLVGLFLGLTLSIKQQGLILVFLIFGYNFILGIYEHIKYKRNYILRTNVLIVVIALLLSSGPLIDQIHRNGVLIQLNYNMNIPPFSDNKFPSDLEAVRELQNIKGYDVKYQSLLETFQVYILHPFLYNKSISALRSTLQVSSYIFTSLFFFTIGCIYIYCKDKIILTLLTFIFTVLVFVTYITNTHPIQYHNMGIAIYSLFIIMGVFNLKSLKIDKHTTISIICIIVILLTSSYVNEVHKSVWNNSGRYDDDYVKEYTKIGKYVQNNTPENGIFLTGGGVGNGFSYYSNRRILWINDFGNANVPLIFKTTDLNTSLYWLKYYEIDYIFIDSRQTNFFGLGDYIPKHGLLDEIDTSPHFREIYSSNVKNESLKLYEIII